MGNEIEEKSQGKHSNIPKHIAIIPDGNRRWAKIHGKSKKEAYATGIKKIKDVAEWCKEEGIKILTMWGFSLENFKREKDEINSLFDLFDYYLVRLLEEYEKKEENKIRVRFLGRIHLFPEKIQKRMMELMEKTKENKEYELNLLLAYGGRAEIVDAVNKIIKKGIKKVDESILSENMYTAGIPDPDLIIRTSGEKRLSGLLPWQSVYSELYFCEKLWPDFSREDLKKAILDFQARKRRFGR